MSFIEGLKTPLDGWNVFVKNTSLRKYVFLPFLLMLLFSILGFFLFLHWMPQIYANFHDVLIKQVEENLRAQYPSEMMEMVMATAEWTVKAMVYIVGFLFFAVLMFIFSSILCSVFWELLAYKVIHHVQFLHAGKTDFKSTFVQPMLREIVKQILFVAVILASYLVVVIPIIGPAISLVLGPIAISVWFSFLICDYWMNAKSYTLAQRLQFIKKEWWYLLGMGTYLIFPVISFVLYPLFVLGAAHQAKSKTDF